jgi:flagellar hook assembly protein FlgD
VIHGDTLGIDDFHSDIPCEFHVRVFPNPFSGDVKIKIEGSYNKNIKCQIYDVQGSLVKDFSIRLELKRLSRAVVWQGESDNGKEMPAGVYFCRVENQSVSSCSKIIKLK